MTIVELDFRYSNNQRTLACVNVYALDFYSKLCAGISEEEMREMKIEIAHNIITNRSIIKKIWDACLEHGYIMQHQDYLGSFVGMIILQT
jgi:hypothetical protein